MSQFTDIAPRLPVADLQRSIAFYQDALGFHLNAAWPDPKFALLKRDEVTIGLFETLDGLRESPGLVELYIEVRDAEDLHAELRQYLPIEWGPEVYSYGRREFAIRDPDSYLVVFTEPTEDPPTTDEP